MAGFVSANGAGVVGGARAAAAQRRATCARSVVRMACASALEKKSKLVSEVSATMQQSTMVLSLPLEGLTVKQVNELKAAVPEGVTVRCVKNTIVKRAVADTEYSVLESGSELTKGHNLWVFIPEESVRGTVEGITGFLKTSKKADTNAINGGVFGGEAYDADGIVALSKLPTKQELYQQIAVGINQVNTKVARAINAPAVKVARAVKLAGEKQPE
ncbi:50S ribosomal protein L10 [Porphyridium purpureum]|uniref:50S ribosomal protein L10 n=1 Tax=Porphyridium purpureum TaxID=35688 RepID=A0A5J4Z5L2_PORPP|nr:50S ribosomal protein L10 [Porphyridium purpureum]|eukprot:POR5419..scf295_1